MKHIKAVEDCLSLARKCIAQERHYFGPQMDQLVDEFMALNIGHSKEIWELIGELLGEITAKDCVEADSLAKEIGLNCGISAFIWKSAKLKQTMYLKFAIKNGVFFYFSLHAVGAVRK